MVSVIVPIYNSVKYLDTCIQSICSQTFTDLEIILVNDASTDGSLERCLKFKEHDERIIILDKQRNEGVEKARYDAVQIVCGDYICFVDSDDWLEHHTIERMYIKALETKADYVEIGVRRVLDRHKLFQRTSCPQVTGMIEQPQLFEKYYMSFLGVNLLSVTIWGKLYKRSIVERMPSPKGLTMGEDLYFNLSIFPFLQKIYIDNFIGYNYRFGGMTTKYNKNLYQNLKLLYSIKKELIIKYNYHKADNYIKYELKNVFISDIKQKIRFHFGTKSQILNQISVELNDRIWNDFVCLDGDKNPIIKHILHKDAMSLYQFCEKEIKKEYLNWMIKRILSKILNVI